MLDNAVCIIVFSDTRGLMPVVHSYCEAHIKYAGRAESATSVVGLLAQHFHLFLVSASLRAGITGGVVPAQSDFVPARIYCDQAFIVCGQALFERL